MQPFPEQTFYSFQILAQNGESRKSKQGRAAILIQSSPARIENSY